MRLCDLFRELSVSDSLARFANASTALPAERRDGGYKCRIGEN